MPEIILKRLREYFRDRCNEFYQRIFIFPEFFDDKKLLISRRYDLYYRKFLRYRDKIKIAVFPDYMYKDVYNFSRFRDVVFIFPLHSKREFSKYMELSERFDVMMIGVPDDRDYTIDWIYKKAVVYMRWLWLLGLKPNMLRYVWLFDGTDITTLSMPNSNYSNARNIENIIKFIEYLKSIRPHIKIFHELD